MLAWGGCGLLAGLLRPFLRRRLAFVAFVLVLGFAFGMLMDTWLWFAFYPHTRGGPARAPRRGRPLQRRARSRERRARARRRAGAETRARAVRTALANGGRVGVKLLAGIAAATALATPAGYVQSLQRDDGGFGDPQITAWATLGLVAAGADTGRAPPSTSRSRSRSRASDVALVGDGACRGGRPSGRSPPAPARAHAREARERDDLDDPGAAAGRRARAAGRSCKALLTAQRPIGRLVVARGRSRRHERHGRRDPGAPRGRRARRADPARRRLPPAPSEPRTEASS